MNNIPVEQSERIVRIDEQRFGDVKDVDGHERLMRINSAVIVLAIVVVLAISIYFPAFIKCLINNGSCENFTRFSEHIIDISIGAVLAFMFTNKRRD